VTREAVGKDLASLFIIASPRPRVGKTLIARLVLEFLENDGRPLIAYDLSPRDPALAQRFPDLTWTVDIEHTRGQMELFDRLIADTETAKVIDLGYGAFERFFSIAEEIGFVQEAERQGVRPILLFVADPSPATAQAYHGLQQRLPLIFVPVHNETVSLKFSAGDFPPRPAACGAIRIARLSPIVRGVVDRPNFSFAGHLRETLGGPTEIHSWIAQSFAEFRELELRLLLGRISATLGDSVLSRRPRRGARADQS
jgi:hypothetical protein